MLTAQELALTLSVPLETVTEWVDNGLPSDRGQFDPMAVRHWLVTNGLAEEEEIVTTRHEVADHFGVNVRIVGEWITDPTFPGKSGRPGTRTGHFPLQSIGRWLKRSKGEKDSGVGPTGRERLVNAKAEREEIRLKEDRGELLEADATMRFYERTNSYVVTTLKQMPGKIDAKLPAGIDDETRSAIREAVVETVDECREMVADLLANDTDDE